MEEALEESILVVVDSEEALEEVLVVDLAVLVVEALAVVVQVAIGKLILFSMRNLFLFFVFGNFYLSAFTQAYEQLPTVEKYIKPFSGIFVSGYVDDGAFINFTGPNLSFSTGKSQFLVGMLPSLRIKQDSGTTTNSMITPTLGFGITYCFRALAFQIPCYYNPKTATKNGEWNIGVGVGIKFSALKFKQN
jgi:hypothetical protein